jgi:hypothetical protein
MHLPLLLQQLQKNMMELLGQAGGNLGTAKYLLAGTGTQTAGLAFGGYDKALPSNSNRRI